MTTIQEISCWDMIQLDFRSTAIHENPFLDATLIARFHHSNGTFWSNGFFDGINDNKEIWRVRFAPMITGHWIYTIISSINELDGTKGEFECVESVNRGGLTVNSQFPNWFFRQDGRPQFIINDGWMPHPGGGLDQFGSDSFEDYPSEEEFEVYLDTLGRHRVNMFLDLKQLYARQEHITDDSFLWPWQTIDPKHQQVRFRAVQPSLFSAS